MSIDYVERERVIDVPKAAGVDGLLHVVKEALRFPRVTSVTIDARGSVRVRHYVRANAMDAPVPLTVDFEDFRPYNIIRNGDVVDLGIATEHDNTPPISPLAHLAMMFRRAEKDHMFPVCFVTGRHTILYDWCGGAFSDDVFGFPVHKDQDIEDDALVLCTAFGRGASIADVRTSYRLTLLKWSIGSAV